MNKIKQSLFDIGVFQNLANDVLKQARELGADQAEMYFAANKGYSVSARKGEVETVEYHQDKVVDITVYKGKSKGSAGISDIRPEAVRKAVEAACHIARFTDEDQAAGLVEKEELAIGYPQLDLNYPWDLSVEEAIKLACQCEREALSFDKRIMSVEEAAVVTGQAIHFYANSHDFMGFFPTSHHEMSCVLVAKQGDEMQRDYSYTIAVDPKELKSVSYIAKNAAERTISRLGARRIPTTKAPIIFHAEEARGFIGHFASAIQGSNLYRKASFLLDMLNQQVFPSFVRIQEHPHLPRALGSAPFDHEGVATRDNLFVDAGILRSYSLSAYAGRKLGMKSTGNCGGVHNFTIEPGDKDLSALIKTMHKGLLITELMGQGVNMVTGDYSRGVGGFWIENGEIAYPVQEITVAGNLRDLYKRIAEVGKDMDVRGSIRTGSILIEEATIAGS